MNEHNKKNKNNDTSRLRYAGILSLLVVTALLLASRLGYLFISDAERFPIITIKVAASYQRITHKELENIITKYVKASFFALSVSRLQDELNHLKWVDYAYVERVWPDTLKIKIIEKKPVAVWGDALMTADGRLFKPSVMPNDLNIPYLQGATEQQKNEVLQVYEKLSKILSSYGLGASGLEIRENQSWVLSLVNGTKIYLGKKELETRLLRFCKAYPAVFAEKAEQLTSVDLRYPRGMAVQWKQQTRR